MPSLLDQLAGGDLRTLGRSADVAAQVLAQPDLLEELLDGLGDADEVIRGRAADALERISAVRPDLIQPFKRDLLARVDEPDHWVVRAHLAQIVPRLRNLTPRERRRLIATLRGWLADKSSIVKAVALDACVQLSLAPGFEAARADAGRLVEDCAARGDTAALRARARLLRKRLAALARPARA